MVKDFAARDPIDELCWFLGSNLPIVSTRNATPSRTTPISRRTSVVWVSFTAAITLVCGVLALSDGASTSQGYLATTLSTIGERSERDVVFGTAAPLDRERWEGVVIHHFGAHGANPDAIHRRHQALGYDGLGYHFVIGNGNGLGDGVIHVGYRWDEQLPGVHTVGPNAAYHNQHSIGICLVGNGNQQPFTDRQMAALLTLLERLQQELDFSGSAIHLHRDVAGEISPQVTSPGKFFPTSRLREQLP
ncbi:MAG: N-acetylmuramoyl-L-alanine amidase [Phycisphaerales bacterium]|nr:MAG: N-acetylmuramoyl-L-alanine amidase [Phycisphaerales bacterium]